MRPSDPNVEDNPRPKQSMWHRLDSRKWLLQSSPPPSTTIHPDQSRLGDIMDNRNPDTAFLGSSRRLSRKGAIDVPRHATFKRATPDAWEKNKAEPLAQKTGAADLFVVPQGFRPNRIFVGMKAQLEMLHSLPITHHRSGPVSIVIAGSPGTGKTHLVRQYIWNDREHYPGGIFWVNASTRESLLQSFREIAQAGRLAENGKDDETKVAEIDETLYTDAVRAWLRVREDWLLVFDGIPARDDSSLEIVKTFRAYDKSCRIIYTSCDPGVITKEHSDVTFCIDTENALRVDDACELLFKTLDVETPTHAQTEKAIEMVNDLNCHPLAIHAVGHRLRTTSLPLEQYCIDQHSSDAMPSEPILSIIDELYRKNRYEALSLIYLASFYDPDHISVSILSLGFNALRDLKIPILDLLGFNAMQNIHTTIDTLVQSGLVVRTNENDRVSSSSPNIANLMKNDPYFSQYRGSGILDVICIHRIVQNTCRDALKLNKGAALKRHTLEVPTEKVGYYELWLVAATRVLCRSFHAALQILTEKAVDKREWKQYFREHRAHAVNLAAYFPAEPLDAPEIVQGARDALRQLQARIAEPDTETISCDAFRSSDIFSSDSVNHLTQSTAKQGADGHLEQPGVGPKADHRSIDSMPLSRVSRQNKDIGSDVYHSDADNNSLSDNFPRDSLNPTSVTSSSVDVFHPIDTHDTDMDEKSCFPQIGAPGSSESVDSGTLDLESQYVSDKIFSAADTSILQTEAITISDKIEMRTIYSDDLSVAVETKAVYIHELAQEISKEIQSHGLDYEAIDRASEVLPECLKAFCLRLGTIEASQLHRDIRVFVHKYRWDIAEAFIDSFSGKRNVPEGLAHLKDMDLNEIMKLWYQNEMNPAVETFQDGATIEDSIEPSAFPPDYVGPGSESSEDVECGLDMPEICKYRECILEDSAYKWLLTDLRRYCFLPPSGSDVIGEIRQKLLQQLPLPRHFSRGQPIPLYKMIYKIDWDPLAFWESQEYKEPPADAIAKAITLTGSKQNSQALSCSEYLQQTWPSSGQQILQLIQEVVRGPRGVQVKDKLSDGTRLSACFTAEHPFGVTINVTGAPYSIVEVGEELAWIGAALRPSPYPEGVIYSRPIVKDIRVIHDQPQRLRQNILAKLQCDLSFYMSPPEGSSLDLNGRCWYGLFRNPVIVEGFPILRRPSSNIATGLEMPLHMMAGLAQARYVNIFLGSLIIKGFSTMLIPTEKRDNVIIWHLIHNKYGDRISYLDRPATEIMRPSTEDLYRTRHVLGWCSEMKFLAGTADANYNIGGSHLPRARENCILNQSSISSGHLITGGTPFAIGHKENPFNISRGGYIRKLKWIYKKSVVLWDEDEKRGWLVNGTSALLHLVRASLIHDSDDQFSSEFLFRFEHLQEASPACCYRPESAISVLINRTNRQLKIYADKDGFIQFEDRVEHLLNILEQMIDHQVYVAGPDGSGYSSKSIPRSHLEGWDFHDLATDADPIYPRVTKLPTIGKTWIDFTRSIHAITLLGCRFGDIIQPAYPHCPHWISVPRDKYYLVTSVADLKGIMELSGDPTASPLRLTECLIWHMPTTPFESCMCAGDHHQEHGNFVQVILPQALSRKLNVTKNTCLSQQGAVIFGYNEKVPWHWGDTGEPEEGALGILDDDCLDASFESVHDLSTTLSTDGSEILHPSTSQTSIDDVSDNWLSASNPIRPGSLARSYTQFRLDSLSTKDYAVGIVCALSLEFFAVRALFDLTHPDVTVAVEDPNHYALGHMGRHKVVAACLPDGEYGTNSAADVASNLRRSFPAVKFCFLVGIGGGAPSLRNDIRLGDVVVSKPIGANPAVIQYDMGKSLENDIFENQGFLHPPPRRVMTALSNLRSDPQFSPETLQEYLNDIAAYRREYRYPGKEHDKLFASNFAHNPRDAMCANCDKSQILGRPARPNNYPHIHYGLIASGNQVMKHAKQRDRWSRDKDVLCFEMEAAGIMNTLPCLVIRGICDYSDSHKNKRFQEYAAAAAASYAKVLLTYLRDVNDLDGQGTPSVKKEGQSALLLDVVRMGLSFLSW